QPAFTQPIAVQSTATQPIVALPVVTQRVAEAPQVSPAPVEDEAAEQRVSEFLRVVGDFDEGIDKRSRRVASAALDRMRELALQASRFDVAVSDCEARLNEMIPVETAPHKQPTAPAPTPPSGVAAIPSAVSTKPPLPAEPSKTAPIASDVVQPP